MSGFLSDRALPHLVNKLSDADNIKITGNKHGDRVGKVVNKLIDKSNETLGASFKELKNEGYSFKAGEGSGVDLSDSTLDSFATFALEGNTYKNLVKNGAEELVLNPEINKEGTGFELDGTSEGGQLGLEIEGQTLKNYMPIEEMKYIQGNNPVIGYINTNNAMTQGKTYTVFFNNINFNVTSLLVRIPEPTTFYSSNFTLKSGILRLKITLDKEIPNDHNINPHFYGDATTEQVKKVRVMILEGDYTQKDVPDFIEGVQGVGRKSKNLFNKAACEAGIVNYITGVVSKGTSGWFISDKIPVKPNTTYSISIKNYGNIRVCEYASNGEFTGDGQRHNKNITTNAKTSYLIVSSIVTDLNNDIQLEQGDHATLYEPYYEGYKIGVKTSSKKQIVSVTRDELITRGFVNSAGWSAISFNEERESIKSVKFKILDPKINRTDFRIILRRDRPTMLEKTKAFLEFDVEYEITATQEERLDIFGIHSPTNGINSTSQAMEIVRNWVKNRQIEILLTFYSGATKLYDAKETSVVVQDQLQGIGDIKDRLYFDKRGKIEQKIGSWHITSDMIKSAVKGNDGNLNYIYYFTGSNLMPNYKPFSKIVSSQLNYDSRYNLGLPFGLSSTSVLIFTFPQGNGLTFEQKHEYVCSYLDKNNGLDVLYVLNTPAISELKDDSFHLKTLSTKTYITQDSGVKGNLKISNKGCETYNLLPNKEYTVMVDKQGTSPITLDLCGVKKVVDGNKGTISTSTNNVGELKFYGNGKVKNIRLLEGNVVDKTVGYFEGVQGVGGKPKNLCKGYGFSMELLPGYYTLSSQRTPGAKRFKITGALKDDLTISDREIYWHEQDRVFVSSNDYEKLNRTFKVNKKCTIQIESRGDGKPYRNLQVESGKESTAYEEYRESSAHIKAHTISKNIISISSMNFPAIEQHNNKTCVVMKDDGEGVFSKGVRFRENTQYTLTLVAHKEADIPQSYCQIRLDYTDGTSVVERPSYGVLKTITSSPQKTLKEIALNRWNLKKVYFELDSLILEEGARVSPHESHEESDFSVELEEPLMRLPNGVCDEITKDGRLIKRVGKVVLTGDESFARNDYEGVIRYLIGVSNSKGTMKREAVISNTLSTTIQSRNDKSNFMAFLAMNKTIYISAPFEDIEDFRQWLRDNQTYIYYELDSPVITDIKPLQARLFKNGHVIFDNKIAPVSTYEVAVNKPAQINAGIKETQKLENRVNALEGLYDSMLLENSHILSNLEFDFSLMKEVEE